MPLDLSRHFQSFFSLILANSIEAKFHVDPQSVYKMSKLHEQDGHHVHIW